MILWHVCEGAFDIVSIMRHYLFAYSKVQDLHIHAATGLLSHVNDVGLQLPQNQGMIAELNIREKTERVVRFHQQPACRSSFCLPPWLSNPAHTDVGAQAWETIQMVAVSNALSSNLTRRRDNSARISRL